MKYEVLKDEFIKLKKEEILYIDTISKISNERTLTEKEKLTVYRKLNNYQNKLDELIKKLWKKVPKPETLTLEELKKVIIEFPLEENNLSFIKFPSEYQREMFLNELGIDKETMNFKLIFDDLWRMRGYRGIEPYIIQNGQRLIEEPIYVYCGIYDSSEECYGPCFGDPDSYLYGIYESISSTNDSKSINKKEIEKFEKDKIIIRSLKYVNYIEIKELFENELLDEKNETINDCINETQNKIKELNYIRSPEYKEKILLNRINELTQKNIEKITKSEMLISETINKNIVTVIGITQDKEYILDFQNSIEFPIDIIKQDEQPLESAKRILKEKANYDSDNLFLVDEIENNDSNIYIVIANNCTKIEEKYFTEKINTCDLFTEKELEYLVYKKILNGAINKLAYYNLMYNVDSCNFISDKKKIYKKQKESINPLKK